MQFNNDSSLLFTCGHDKKLFSWKTQVLFFPFLRIFLIPFSSFHIAFSLLYQKSCNKEIINFWKYRHGSSHKYKDPLLSTILYFQPLSKFHSGKRKNPISTLNVIFFSLFLLKIWEQQTKFSGHSGIINSIHLTNRNGQFILFSGSDDNDVFSWNIEVRSSFCFFSFE